MLRVALAEVLAPERNADVVAHLLLGALEEAVMVLASSTERRQALRAVVFEVDVMVDRLIT